MRILKTRKDLSAESYSADNVSLYTFSLSKDLVEISVFDSESFERLKTFHVYYKPNPLAKPIIDDNCIYLPDIDGKLVCLDKFSGQHMPDIDFGMMTCWSNLAQNEEFIYSICGIPIINGLQNLSKSFVICKNCKHTGKKIAQSQLFQGSFSEISLDDQNIWISINRIVYKFSMDLEIESQKIISFESNYAPLRFKDWVMFSTNLGYLEIFRSADLQSVTKMVVSANRLAPSIYQNIMTWITSKKITFIDLEGAFSRINVELDTTCLDRVKDNNHIYAVDSLGRVLDINCESRSVFKIGVDSGPLYKTAISGDYLFVSNQKEIHQLCVKSQLSA